jgi:hypothetical protein
MKKRIYTIVFAAILNASSLSAAWINGTVDSVIVYPDGVIKITLLKADNTKLGAVVDATLGEETKKSILAVALTAKSTVSDVSLNYAFATSKWDAIEVK